MPEEYTSTTAYRSDEPSTHSGTAAGGLQGSSTVPPAAREQAGAMWEEAKEKARSAVDEQQKSTAAQIGDFAGALRTAAADLQSKQKTTAAQLGQRTADGLEHLADLLRRRDATTLMHDAERFARREPALFLGATVAAGFLAMRFLKSSGADTGSGSHDFDRATPDAPASAPAPSTTFPEEV